MLLFADMTNSKDQSYQMSSIPNNFKVYVFFIKLNTFYEWPQFFFRGNPYRKIISC